VELLLKANTVHQRQQYLFLERHLSADSYEHWQLKEARLYASLGLLSKVNFLRHTFHLATSPELRPLKLHTRLLSIGMTHRKSNQSAKAMLLAIQLVVPFRGQRHDQVASTYCMTIPATKPNRCVVSRSDHLKWQFPLIS